MAIQEETFYAGGTSDVRGYKIKLELIEQSTSVSANVSEVSYTFSIERGPNYGFYTGPYFDWNISIGGRVIAIRDFAFNIPTTGGNTQVISSGKLVIGHNPDGSMDMPFEVSIPDTRGVVPKYGPQEIKLTGSWKLTTIPRASSVAATDADIGSSTVIKISRASAAFTHTVTCSFGGKTYPVAEKSPDTTLLWPIPGEDFYPKLPTEKFGVVTVTCQTYSGGTAVGGPTTTTFRAIVSESLCKPTVLGAAGNTDETTNALTDGQAIRYISTVVATAEVAGVEHATISRVLINGVEAVKQEDGRYSVEFIRADAYHYVYEVWDSRGYYNSTYLDIQMHDYTPFSCIPIIKRVTPTSKKVRVTLRGNFWAKNFSAVNKNEMLLTVKFRKQGESLWSAEHQLTPVIDKGAGTYTAELDLTGGPKDYESVWEYEVYGQDRAMNLTQLVILPEGLPLMDIGAKGINFNVPLSYLDHEMDFVIDAGASGIWSYRKWYSGKAECWGLASKTVTNWGSNEWGGVYNCANVSLPFGFVEVSVALANVASGTTYAPAYGDPAEILGTGAATFNCNLPGTGSKSFKTSMLVVGRWK